MLNQHEVAAHNLKVALKAADKLIDRLAETPDPISERKPATRSALPTCKPEARAPRKIFRSARPVRCRAATVSSAMPAPVGERIAPRNGLIVSSARVPQVTIDMKKVARYLAK